MSSLRVSIVKVLFYVFRIFPIVSNKIVICSYLGRGYGGEGKTICDRLIGKGYDIVWLVRDLNEQMPHGVRKVKYLSLQSVYEQVTAKIWIDNRRKPLYVRKRKNQKYIQLWHGDICIKYVEKDAQDHLPKNYIKAAKNDSNMADAFIAGTKWRKENYRNSFWFDGEILEGDLYKEFHIGDNRNELKRKAREYLKIAEEYRIVTYAPTFRKTKTLDCYDMDYKRLIDTLEREWGGKWVVAVRLHPNIAQLSASLEYSDRIINASMYPQINDMILASDILITDYSGCMFEGYRAGKIVIMYASDYIEYINNDRGMYFDYKDLPAPVALNNDELESVITKFDLKEYEKKRTHFVKQIGYYDVDGADIVVKWIEQKIKK